MNTDVMQVRAMQTRLELGRHRVGDLRGAPGALLRLTAGPQVEIGVLVLQPEPHRDRVDQLLEAIAELAGDGLRTVTGFDHRRHVLPGDDLIARHPATRARTTRRP